MPDLPLVRHDLGAPFAHRETGSVTAAEFLGQASDLAHQLPDRRYVVNLCADRYHFALAFAAALMRSQVSLMPPNQTPDLFRRLVRDYPGVYCLHDDVAEDWAVPSIDCRPFDKRGPAASAIPRLPEERIAAIVFTSGSTGDPLPHPKPWGGLVASARAEIERLGVEALPGMALLGTVPPQHMYGLESTVLMALQGRLVLHARRPFLPAEICAALEALPRPRGLVTTPVHLRAVLAAEASVPPLDFLLCATAPLSPQLAAQAEACFAAPLYEIYGCTEVGQLASRRTTETAEWQLFPGFALRHDERGAWLSGSQGECLLSDVIEPLGRNRFLLHGRTADLVNIAGKRTSLASLNFHLNSIPGVRDAAFVVPEDGHGAVARLAAFVVAPGLSRKAILSALRQRIDPAFLPRPLRLVEALPRNDTGKLARTEITKLMAKVR